MRNSRCIARSALVVGCLGLFGVGTGLTCAGDGIITQPGGPSILSCGTAFTPGWPVDYASVTLNHYGSCPFNLPYATDVPYDATATFSPSSSVSYGSFIQTSVIDRNGAGAVDNIDYYWYDDAQGNYDADLAGDYWAGSGGFDNSTNPPQGFDSIHVTVSFGNGYQTASTAEVYHFGNPGTWLLAPDSIGAGVDFIASAGNSDINYIKPVTYQWTVNGQPIENDSDELDWTQGYSGSTRIAVKTTDGNGKVYSTSHTIYSCSNNQLEC